LLGDGLTTVEVKEGLGRFSARMKTPRRVRELIGEGARKALANLSAVAPYDPGRPCEIEIEFTTPDRLREYANRKDVEVTGATSRTGARSIVSSVIGPPDGAKMRSTSAPLSCHALYSQPSGGRSARRPACSIASSAASASSGLIMKSTSCSLFGPPRAHAA